MVKFTPGDCTYTVYDVDKDRNSSDAEKKRVVQYRVPDGEVELQEY